jgi:SAM-dependent methyltransferase
VSDARHEERVREVVAFYDDLLSGKEGSEVLGFSSDRSQRVRFDALCGVADLGGRSVLDVGCGRGDLFGYLRDRGLDVDYRGVDIHPGLIDLARRTWPDGRFDVRDLLADDAVDAVDEADYVLASGIFGLTPNGDPAFVDAMLERMVALARRGVAVNFLSTWTPNPQDPRSWYADPVETLARARRLTPRVVLRHDYKPNDFALYLRLDEPGGNT